MKRIIIRNLIILSICLFGIYLLNDYVLIDVMSLSLILALFTFSYFEYNRLKAKNQKIEAGIEEMQKACFYSHDNLLMTEERDQICVKNQFLWQETDRRNKGLIEAGIQSLVDDFDALAKANRKFRNYAQGKEVQFVLIDYIGGVDPIELGSKTISYGR